MRKVRLRRYRAKRRKFRHGKPGQIKRVRTRIKDVIQLRLFRRLGQCTLGTEKFGLWRVSHGRAFSRFVTGSKRVIRDARSIHLVFTRNGFGLGRHMAAQGQTKQRGLRLRIGALLLIFSGGSIAYAQDASLSTPPELRDFRLDSPPQTAPGPEVRPQLPKQSTQDAPPPAPQPTTQLEPAPVVQEQRSPVAQPQRVQPIRPDDAPQDAQAEPDAGTPLLSEPQRSGAAPAQTEPPLDPVALGPTEEAGTGITEVTALAALMLVIAAASYLLWRRRTAAQSVVAPQLRKAAKPALPRLANAPVQSHIPPFIPKQRQSPVRAVTISFVPQDAVISFSSLTIQGQMQIGNTGEADSGDMVLHAALISASSEQQRNIESFFAHPDRYAPTPLASVKSGENIGLPLKLGVALNEMQTFSLQDKTLLAPILVAKISRLLAESAPEEVARLVCMIGREASPPQLKMAPLRLDQGPRRFDRLGQRALAS